MAYWVPLSGQVAFLWDLVKDASTLVKSVLLSLSVRTCFFFFFFEPGVSSAKLHRTVLLHFPRDLCFPVLAPNGVIVCVFIKTLRCVM